MSREALVLLVCCCDFRDRAERLIPSKSLRNAVIRAFPGLFCILRMCAPRRAAAVVRPRGREKSADRRRRILISRLLIIRASVPRWKSPFPAYFKGFPAVSPLIPPYPAFLKYPVSPQLGLRKRHPELGRPYKAPLIEVGVPVSILIYAIMLFQLDRYAIVSGIIWCVVGLVVYYICHAKYGDSNILNINDSITDEAPPSPEERAKMDKEYLLWKSIVAAFCIIAVLLYVIPLIF